MSQRKHKRKATRKPKDKNKPKRSASSYILFSNEVRPSFRAKNANMAMTEIAKLIGKRWKTMTDNNKQKYKQKAALLRQQYQEQLTEYQQSTHYKQHQAQLREWEQKSSKTKRKNRKKHANHNHDFVSSLSSNLSDSELSEEFEGIDTDFVQHLRKQQDSKKKSTGKFQTQIRRNKRRTQHVGNDGDDITLKDASRKNKAYTFACRMCLQRFADQNALQQHEKRLHIKQCTKCELKFRTATCLEEHMYEKHNLYAPDANHNDRSIYSDKYGNYKMNAITRTTQTQRMRHQMRAITDRVVVDSNRTKRHQINAQSHLKKKRHNMGRSMKWTNKDTMRFYQCLKFSGLNFTFMEVLYNRAISNEEYAQIEQPIDDKTKTETDVKKEKKKKKWVYRDAKTLKQKYNREEKHNYDTITWITQSVKFTKEISNKIDTLVKKNEFKWKDEEYYEDSDVEMDKLYKKKEKKGDEEPEEGAFDPLIAFEDEIEEDRREKQEIKRLKEERLKAWRRKQKKIEQDKLMQFKRGYEKYKQIKNKGMSVQDYQAMAKKIENTTNTNTNNQNNDHESFDPFATLSDNDNSHSASDDVNGYHSDESNGRLKCRMYKEYNIQEDDCDDFDIDADPFE
eukprot:502571_1